MTDFNSNSNSNDKSVHSLLDDATEVLENIGIELEDAEEADEAGIDLETDFESDADSEEVLPEPLASSDLPALAQSAHDLLEERDVDRLLEEIGFDDVDEDAPESIPAAILAGDPGDVSTLRGVQRLARLAEIQDEDGAAESVEETIAELRTILARRRDEDGGDASEASQNEPVDEAEDQAEAEDESEDESDTDADADKSDEAADESDGTDDGTAADDESEGTDDEPSDSEDGGIGSSITDTLGESVSGFRDEIEAVQNGLEAIGADDDSGKADDDGSSDDGVEGDTGDGEGVEGDTEDEAEESDSDEDDGLLSGSGDSRRRGTMYSTVALSPSKRTDMKAVKRHSTVPDRR
ncbi:hypothetical protein [Natronosalvus vescus]|uniref:hypothetical protein n=1 Tax=Natronosalvus vescus TaxID=2953881 RepID=UPI00209091E5|nr:hypothetical protein [Natronosalvus vescus]